MIPPRIRTPATITVLGPPPDLLRLLHLVLQEQRELERLMHDSCIARHEYYRQREELEKQEASIRNAMGEPRPERVVLTPEQRAAQEERLRRIQEAREARLLDDLRREDERRAQAARAEEARRKELQRQERAEKAAARRRARQLKLARERQEQERREAQLKREAQEERRRIEEKRHSIGPIHRIRRPPLSRLEEEDEALWEAQDEELLDFLLGGAEEPDSGDEYESDF